MCSSSETGYPEGAGNRFPAFDFIEAEPRDIDAQDWIASASLCDD